MRCHDVNFCSTYLPHVHESVETFQIPRGQFDPRDHEIDLTVRWIPKAETKHVLVHRGVDVLNLGCCVDPNPSPDSWLGCVHRIGRPDHQISRYKIDSESTLQIVQRVRICVVPVLVTDDAEVARQKWIKEGRSGYEEMDVYRPVPDDFRMKVDGEWTRLFGKEGRVLNESDVWTLSGDVRNSFMSYWSLEGIKEYIKANGFPGAEMCTREQPAWR